MGVGESTDDAFCPLFDETNTSFNVPYMLSSHQGIPIKHGDMITYFFKFNIHQNCLNSEASPCVDTDDALKKRPKCGCSAWGWCVLNSYKNNVLRGWLQQWNRVDKHDIHRQCYLFIHVHKRTQDIHIISNNTLSLRRIMLPLIVVRSMPKSMWAFLMLSLVTGQSFSMLRHTIPSISRGDGVATIPISPLNLPVREAIKILTNCAGMHLVVLEVRHDLTLEIKILIELWAKTLYSAVSQFFLWI